MIFSQIKRIILKYFPKSFIGFITYFITRPKKSFSQYSEDLLLETFLDKKNGFYIDIGCFHPKRHSNTFKLYKKGWQGINIDIDEYKIKNFNFFRNRDMNFACALSDKENELNIYMQSQSSYGSFTTLNREFAKTHSSLLGREIKTKKIISLTLNQVLCKYKMKKYLPSIDLLCIDV